MSNPIPTNNNTRSDSVSSAGSRPASPTARRASSGLFANLTAQKRGSDDPTSVARRQSMHDARKQSGFIGKMWNNFVHGPSQ